MLGEQFLLKLIKKQENKKKIVKTKILNSKNIFQRIHIFLLLLFGNEQLLWSYIIKPF